MYTAEEFGGHLKFFGKGQGGVTKIFDRRKGGCFFFFSSLIKNGSIILWIFVLKKTMINLSLKNVF